jgi:hypothetical protein
MIIKARSVILLTGAVAATLQSASVKVRNPQLAMSLGLASVLLAAIAEWPRLSNRARSTDTDDDE